MSTPRTVSARGIELIKEFEGMGGSPPGAPYLDRLANPPVWTRGYGRTKGIGPNSPQITQAAATRELKDLLADYLPAIWALPVTLNQSQLDALASFVWNVGTGGVAASTGVGRALRRKDWRAAADELLKWDKAGGRALPGLTRRRHAERALFLLAAPKAGPTSWLTPVELRRVRELDAIRGGAKPAHPRREAVLVRLLADQRRRLWRAAQGPGGWGHANRAKRYASLKART